MGLKEESLVIAKKELKKESLERFLQYLFLFFSVVSMLGFLTLISLEYLEFTGFAGYVAAKAGYITEVTLYSKLPTYIWGGVYGLALSVPGFTEQIHTDLDSATIGRADIFFDCLDQAATGGVEIYVSNSSTLDLESGTVTGANLSEIDAFLGCSGSEYCPSNTFTENMSFYLGSTAITNVPSTHTYRFDGNNTIFQMGAIKVDDDLAFVTKVQSIQKGYSPNVTVNYQVLLPTPENSTTRFYFYSDPNDVCPAGGFGTSLNATISGYVFDYSSNPLEDALVTVAGYSTTTNSLGYYNLSSLVLEGEYNAIAQKEGYDPNLTLINISFSDYVVEQNFSLKVDRTGGSETLNVLVYGYTKNSVGDIITGVNVSFGNISTFSNESGYYSVSTSVPVGFNPIIAFKTGYDNYYELLEINASVSSLEHNITMEIANLFDFQTGPDPSPGDSTEDNSGQYDIIAQIVEELGQDYWVSTSEIKQEVRQGTFIQEEIKVFNFRSSTFTLVFTLPSNMSDFIKLDRTSLAIVPGGTGTITLTILGTRPVGTYTGVMLVSGDLDQKIPIEISIVERKLPIETLLLDSEVINPVVRPGNDLRYKIQLQNLLVDQSYKVLLTQSVLSANDSVELISQQSEIELRDSYSLVNAFEIPSNYSDGEYVLKVNAQYLNLVSSVTSPFVVSRPIYLYSFFGIPIWILLVGISMLCFLVFDFFLYKSHLDKKKRYHIRTEFDTLPKPGERSIKVGKVAESNVPAYVNLDDLTTHAIVAGATGGGKSITAQVLIEEALKKNISVIVFDPTAQWSGMLRKCTDKRMLSLYPKFGLKPSDAQAFPGNVRQVRDYRQKIDISKHMNPGQITIFTMNKLDPKQIDVFVAGVIAEIFRSDPKEHPGLKTLLVFDEVHRLLPKFGGSGKGFLQIERACREFRKWGLGVLLVSQVLSDFVGEIKANINTEMQMRVAEENDLERIRSRYGPESLKSLVRADVGTGMVQNAEYNRGRPYFVSFRPILHNTRRLTDEVLDKYNQYGDTIDDLDYQLEQLEKEKVDIFDLKMELKLVKDKLMTGNFAVVDIYLEGLLPRLKQQWSKLGKEPKKREVELIDESALASSLTAAQKERDKWKKENSSSGEEKKEEKKEVSIKDKIVRPLTFDNGMMISSLGELLSVLPNFDPEIFVTHVNEEKNDIATWAGEAIDPKLGESLKGILDKGEIVNKINEFVSPKKKEEEKSEDGKESSKEKSDEKKKDEDDKSEESSKESPTEDKSEVKDVEKKKVSDTKETPKTATKTEKTSETKSPEKKEENKVEGGNKDEKKKDEDDKVKPEVKKKLDENKVSDEKKIDKGEENMSDKEKRG